MKIKITDIEVGPRFLDVDLDLVAARAEDMRLQGQIQPIAIVQKWNSKGWLLIAGKHRLEAAKLLGWTHIEADPKEIEAKTERQFDVRCRIMELSENMQRRVLSRGQTKDHLEQMTGLWREDENIVRDEDLKAVAAAEEAEAARLRKLAKDEEDAAEKKRLQDEAKKSDERARRASSTVNGGSHSNDRGADRVIEKRITERLSKVSGLSEKQVRSLKVWHEALGPEFSRLAEGTHFDSEVQDKAFVSFRKVFPKEAEAHRVKVINFLKSFQPGEARKINPQDIRWPNTFNGEHGKLSAEKSRKAKEALDKDARDDDLTAWKKFRDMLGKARTAVADLRDETHRNKCLSVEQKALLKLSDAISDMTTRVNANVMSLK